MHVTITPPANRGPVLYARLKEVNHSWMHQEARRNGFDSVSAFTDALIDNLRTGQPVTMETAPKTNMKKAPKRVATGK